MSEVMNDNVICDVDLAWEIMMANKKNVRVAVQVSPAARVAIGEEFGLVKGEDALGKLTTALRVLGVDVVVDGAIADDVAVYDLAKEVQSRIACGGKLPVVFSQKTEWTQKAMENPELAPYVVSVRPAMQALAVAIKKMFLGDGKRTYVIAVVPCKCKKALVSSMGLRQGEKPAVDLALTTVELADILRSAELDLKYIPASPWDEPFGVPSGSGYIADIGGGVAEGVLRMLASDQSEEGIRRIEYSGVRGYKSYRVGYSDVNAIVASGEDAEKVAADVVAGDADCAFVEIVGNPLGCVAGGGQPDADDNTKRMRAYALYALDKRADVRVAGLSEDTVALSAAFAADREDDGFDEAEVSLSPFDEDEVVEAPVPVEEPAPVEEPVEEEAVEEPVPMEEPVVEEAVEELVSVEEPVVEEAVEAPAPVEEPVVEEAVEEPVPVEEPVVEEVVEELAPVEEPAVEEAAEEPVVEEAVEEPAPVEELVVEEAVEEPAPVEELVVEEAAEEPVPVEEPVVEEAVEEPVPVEEPVVEEVAEEPAPVEEPVVEEAVEEKGPKSYDPNYRRMSKKERRKLKRAKNG
ncbi:MAG: hypothetical protein E7367_03580 [Clostridiales bacterium]|nr:hypothetical protein [Clostridiales bacterium]